MTVTVMKRLLRMMPKLILIYLTDRTDKSKNLNMRKFKKRRRRDILIIT